MAVGDLAKALADFGGGYLLTTSGDGRVKAVTVEPVLTDGDLVVVAPGRGTSANVDANPAATLLFPPLAAARLHAAGRRDGGGSTATTYGSRRPRAVLHAARRPIADGTARVKPTWLTAFLDLPPDGVRRRRERSGRASPATSVSPRRGEHGEFATLVPPEGDAFLRVQRLDDGPGGVHLDVHRPGAAVRRCAASPGGLDFCEVSEPLSRRPPPATWPDGHWSIVDQVCLDIPRVGVRRASASSGAT